MKVQRTIPPAAAPIGVKSLVHGFAGMMAGRGYQKRLERELKEYFKVDHVFLVSSGKAALTIILRALKTLSPGKREVLIPAYTCFSLPSAIVKAGLMVSLCDVNDTTFDFDTAGLGKELNEKTLCVIPDHLFGIPSDMDGIAKLAHEKGAFVVEDAAQAMGGLHKGKKLGAIGDVGFFSLGRGKNMTCGSGGIVITNSDRIASALEDEYAALERPHAAENLVELLKAMMLALFIRPSLYWMPAGLPFLKLGETIFYKDFPIKRLSEMKAALLTGWTARLERSNRIRKENTEYVCGCLGLTHAPDCSRPLLRLPLLADDRKTRDRICSRSRERGMGLSCMYPTPVNKIREIEDLFFGKTFPVAASVAERILTLPTHEYLSDEDKRALVRFIKSMTFPAGEAIPRLGIPRIPSGVESA